MPKVVNLKVLGIKNDDFSHILKHGWHTKKIKKIYHLMGQIGFNSAEWVTLESYLIWETNLTFSNKSKIQLDVKVFS